MILDLKDVTSWDTIVGKGLGAILGYSYSDTVKKNAAKIQYRDSESEAYNIKTAYRSICPVRQNVRGIFSRELKSNCFYLSFTFFNGN